MNVAQDKDVEIAKAAMLSMGKIGGEEAKKELMDIVSGESAILKGVNRTIVDVHALKCAALKALSNIEDGEVLSLFEGLLMNREGWELKATQELRLLAVLGLINNGSPRAKAVLTKVFKRGEPDNEVRAEAVKGLCKLKVARGLVVKFNQRR